jgi:hypothetical protein
VKNKITSSLFQVWKNNDGDFKIKYTVSRFESMCDEDYVQTYYQNSAYYLGMESNLEIMDKTGKVIYKRYTSQKLICM